MDTIRWDAMAALIAMIGLPFMLSGSATWLIKTIIRRIQRFILPHGATCQRLEWQDIPDGQLCGPLEISRAVQNSDPPYRHFHPFEHRDKECLKSSLWKVFERAEHEKAQRVFKPYPLDPTKQYVRTDRKILEAFLLLSHTNVIQFQVVEGILTAHLPVIDSISNSSSGELHNRTKHEVEMILRGYPPFYLQEITVTHQTKVLSPILEMEDTRRGGWILGVGLDSLSTPPLSTHNMKRRYDPPAWATTKYGDDEWMFTSIPSAINRFGEVLNKLVHEFPEQNAAKGAFDIYQLLTGDPEGKRFKFDDRFSTRRISRPFSFLTGYPEFKDIETHVMFRARRNVQNLKFSPGPLPCWSELNEDEWQLAMSAFNQFGPLTDTEKKLFSEKLLPILQAGMLGLLCVFSTTVSGGSRSSRTVIGGGRPLIMTYRELPSHPELTEHRYVYLSQCEPTGED
ncbi:hypothetical protein BJ166DRAFT_508320 [Pestalotiopsis sp. NC0098]|nr:hypothetical protein BJ166DRAFT_508320 [Pestalotiopsis sp. NC0098]